MKRGCSAEWLSASRSRAVFLQNRQYLERLLAEFEVHSSSAEEAERHLGLVGANNVRR